MENHSSNPTIIPMNTSTNNAEESNLSQNHTINNNTEVVLINATPDPSRVLNRLETTFSCESDDYEYRIPPPKEQIELILPSAAQWPKEQTSTHTNITYYWKDNIGWMQGINQHWVDQVHLTWCTNGQVSCKDDFKYSRTLPKYEHLSYGEMPLIMSLKEVLHKTTYGELDNMALWWHTTCMSFLTEVERTVKRYQNVQCACCPTKYRLLRNDADLYQLFTSSKVPLCSPFGSKCGIGNIKEKCVLSIPWNRLLQIARERSLIAPMQAFVKGKASSHYIATAQQAIHDLQENNNNQNESENDQTSYQPRSETTTFQRGNTSTMHHFSLLSSDNTKPVSITFRKQLPIDDRHDALSRIEKSLYSRKDIQLLYSGEPDVEKFETWQIDLVRFIEHHNVPISIHIEVAALTLRSRALEWFKRSQREVRGYLTGPLAEFLTCMKIYFIRYERTTENLTKWRNIRWKGDIPTLFNEMRDCNEAMPKYPYELNAIVEELIPSEIWDSVSIQLKQKGIKHPDLSSLENLVCALAPASMLRGRPVSEHQQNRNKQPIYESHRARTHNIVVNAMQVHEYSKLVFCTKCGGPHQAYSCEKRNKTGGCFVCGQQQHNHWECQYRKRNPDYVKYDESEFKPFVKKERYTPSPNYTEKKENYTPSPNYPLRKENYTPSPNNTSRTDNNRPGAHHQYAGYPPKRNTTATGVNAIKLGPKNYKKSGNEIA